MAHTEQITFLLFLKMADEQSKPPYNKKIGVPDDLDWASLLQRDGEELERHYRKILDELGKKSGMLGAIFKKARQDIQNPATLRRGNRRVDRHRELVQHAGRYQERRIYF